MSRYFLKKLQNGLKDLIPQAFLPAGYALFPSRIDIELTHNCNLRCVMCSFVEGSQINKAFSNEKRSKHEYQADLPSLEEWDKFFSGIRRRSPVINISGGEPMLHPGFRDIAAMLKKYGFTVTMTTNATLIDEDMADFVSAHFDAIVISVDGNREVHDRIRNSPGAFEKTYKAIGLLNELKKKRKVRTPRITINSTISWENCADLSFAGELYGRFAPYKWNISHLFLGNGDTADRIEDLYGQRNDLEALQEIYSRIDPDLIYEEVLKLKKSPAGKHLSFLPSMTKKEMRKFYKEPRIALRKKCRYPFRSCVIQGDGSVITCMYFKMGSIRDDFHLIWDSHIYRDFRQALSRELFSKCSRCCGLYE